MFYFIFPSPKTQVQQNIKVNDIFSDWVGLIVLFTRYTVKQTLKIKKR